MSTPTDPRREFTHPGREHPHTYFVQDRSNEDELTRLRIQDRLVTTSMGGVLSEQPDPSIFGGVLDVGCGTGGWLIEAARTYPSMSYLVGVDVSSRMVQSAQAQAEAEQVSDRVQFRAMDALRMLEFPANSFDLVNLRLGMSFLRKWDWPKLLQEFLRVVRSGGVIRVTELDIIAESSECSSPALLRLNRLLLEAFYQAGHLFSPTGDGLTGELARLLHQHGFGNVQTQIHKRVYRAGTPEGQQFAEDMALAYHTLVPFLRKWTRLPDDYEATYQQMQDEVRQESFVATGSYLTAWGQKPL